MSRTRGPVQVALPRIEPDETRTIRLGLKGRLLADLDDYRAAYRETYDVEVELDALIPHILETYIASDRSFKAWRGGRGGARAEGPPARQGEGLDPPFGNGVMNGAKPPSKAGDDPSVSAP